MTKIQCITNPPHPIPQGSRKEKQPKNKTQNKTNKKKKNSRGRYTKHSYKRFLYITLQFSKWEYPVTLYHIYHHDIHQ